MTTVVVTNGQCHEHDSQEVRLLREILAVLLRIEELLKPVSVEIPKDVSADVGTS